MFSRCREVSLRSHARDPASRPPGPAWRALRATLTVVAAAAGWTTLPAGAPVQGEALPRRVLHVEADPNNLPFSNARGEGFENKIVELVAQELGARVEYTWWAQRRGWVRNTFKQGHCDLVAGVPVGFHLLLTTRPYYRSTYAIVYRRDRPWTIRSLDDPLLRKLRIGVQMIGDDASNTPPAHALSHRGIITNVRGYTVYGDYRQPNPPARIVDAVLRGEIDVAFTWGPLAGYFAHQHAGMLTVVPLPPSDPGSEQQFAFDIAMGVRKSEPALRDQLNAILVRDQAKIRAILGEYGVPVVATDATASNP